MRIIDADGVAFGTTAVQNGFDLFLGRLVAAKVLKITVAACALFVTRTGFAVRLLFDAADTGKTHAGKTLDI